MKQAVSSIANLFGFNSNLFQERIAELDQEQLSRRVSENANPIIWIAGHLTNSRIHVAELLGDKQEYDWMPVFKEAYDSGAQYPDIAELRQAWDKASETMMGRLESTTQEGLSEDIGYSLPHGDSTVGGALVFWLYHEAWHLGQIAYIRKCMEMEGLVPY